MLFIMILAGAIDRYIHSCLPKGCQPILLHIKFLINDNFFAIFHALFMGCSYEREDGPVISFQTAQQAPRKVLGSLGGSEEGRNWEGDEQGIILGRLAC